MLSVRRWAGLVAIAAQIHGGGLGQINPTLYAIGALGYTNTAIPPEVRTAAQCPDFGHFLDGVQPPTTLRMNA